MDVSIDTTVVRLLVVGAGGLVGSNLLAIADGRGWDVLGTYHTDPPAVDVPVHRLDVTDADEVQGRVRAADPDCVVNAAAMTDVDECERRPERAADVNARAPGDIAAACSEVSAGLAHLSTDYVFDGRRTDPYREHDDPDPLQRYGETKRAGERRVRDATAGAVIVRLSFVYGTHGITGNLTGFPAWVRNRLASGEETPLFTDQRVTPTRAEQAAKTVLDLVAADATGRFHVASRSCVTPYRFGRAIADRANGDESLLRAGSTDEVERAAARPANSCLDVRHVEERLGRNQPTIEADLDAIADAIRV
jgi:dTDP-4-dehydrorhamnose reductase